MERKLKTEQDALKKKSEGEKKDTLNTDYYKIFYLDGRIDNVDTTLNIYKDYKFNFLREDSFDLISFANTGVLSFFQPTTIFPNLSLRSS